MYNRKVPFGLDVYRFWSQWVFELYPAGSADRRGCGVFGSPCCNRVHVANDYADTNCSWSDVSDKSVYHAGLTFAGPDCC